MIRVPSILICILLLSFSVNAEKSDIADFESQVRPFINKYCHDCHGGKKVKGKVDFTKITTAQELDASFELWESVVDLLMEGEMPPDAAKQPPAGELTPILSWYKHNFVDSVEPHPGVYQVRRLSAHEYRNTIGSILGFDPEVSVMEAEQTDIEWSLIMKLLPTDPPGKSGFKNDTSGNPLTSIVWDQYSFILDTALNEWFSPKRKTELERLAGPVPETGFSFNNAKRLIHNVAPLAFRRSTPKEETDAIIEKLEKGTSLVNSTKFQIKAMLMSPTFLYRGILNEGEPGKVVPVDDFELAERLSYFLWGDMPDEELMRHAAEGTLSSEDVLANQVHRALDSKKSRNLATDFAVQWLALDEIDQFKKQQLPLAKSLKEEPIEFFDYLIREDRPLLELIDSRVTFISQHTGKFYPVDRKQLTPVKRAKGIELFTAPVERIEIKEAPARGGLLTMPGVLAMNKGPVLRGTWMLERILGEHLPDPPADVGQVPQNKRGQNLSFRERFEMHRANDTCAVCHNKIDPLGFALQAYDKTGTYVLTKGYKPPKGAKPEEYDPARIDTTGQLPSGETFKDFNELKRILKTTEKEPIVRNIVKQMLSYALARKLEIYDQPAVESITKEMIENDGTYRELILAIAKSLPFRYTEFKGPKS